MQFTINQRITDSFVEVQFDSSNHKLPVIESFELSFQRIGGIFKDNGVWHFPNFISSAVISKIIHTTCFVCGGLMQDEIVNTHQWVVPDGIQVIPKKVRKCSSCGHSHT